MSCNCGPAPRRPGCSTQCRTGGASDGGHAYLRPPTQRRHPDAGSSGFLPAVAAAQIAFAEGVPTVAGRPCFSLVAAAAAATICPYPAATCQGDAAWRLRLRAAKRRHRHPFLVSLADKARVVRISRVPLRAGDICALWSSSSCAILPIPLRRPPWATAIATLHSLAYTWRCARCSRGVYSIVGTGAHWAFSWHIQQHVGLHMLPTGMASSLIGFTCARPAPDNQGECECIFPMYTTTEQILRRSWHVLHRQTVSMAAALRQW